MASSAAFINAKETKGKLAKKYTYTMHNLYYSLMAREASYQFRYYMATQKLQHEIKLDCFNMMNNSKSIKKGLKMEIDGIQTKQVFYAPMITNKFDLEESKSYDNLTEERFD